MFHEATDLKFNKGTELEVTFLDGKVKKYDMKKLFNKYPILETLNNRSLFLAGKLDPYGITWSDEIDIDIETIYQHGTTIRHEKINQAVELGCILAEARGGANMTQTDLAKATGIDQGDISKIERGKANPSLNTLVRLAEGLGCEISIVLNPSRRL